MEVPFKELRVRVFQGPKVDTPCSFISPGKDWNRWCCVSVFKNLRIRRYTLIRKDLFTVVCLVTWPLNESEAGVDLVMIETSLLFLCKFLHKNIMNIRKRGRSVS